MAFVVLATVLSDRAEDLERTGRRVPGQVVEAPDKNVLGSSIRVGYGNGRSARIFLHNDSPSYEVGQNVIVVIDRDDPDHVSIVGERTTPPGSSGR